MLLALWSELAAGRRQPQRTSRLHPPPSPPVPVAIPVAQAVPVAILVSAQTPAAPSAPVRRLGSSSHLRSLTPQEVLLCLLGQLSALMDARDSADWTINPAYHPDVNAYIEKHSANQQFVTKARALQRNRAPYYGKTVVPGPRRNTILTIGRSTVVD